MRIHGTMPFLASLDEYRKERSWGAIGWQRVLAALRECFASLRPQVIMSVDQWSPAVNALIGTDVKCQVARRIFSTEPVRIRFDSPFGRSFGVGLLVFFSVLAFRPGQTREFDPNCGPMQAAEIDVLHRLRRPYPGDQELVSVLLRLEKSGSSAERHSARKIRLQCGFLKRRDEIIEATGLQISAAGVTMEAGVAPAYFVAAQNARDSNVTLSELSERGRFSTSVMLDRQFAQAPSNPPSEFDLSRYLLPLILDQLRLSMGAWR